MFVYGIYLFIKEYFIVVAYLFGQIIYNNFYNNYAYVCIIKQKPQKSAGNTPKRIYIKGV